MKKINKTIFWIAILIIIMLFTNACDDEEVPFVTTEDFYTGDEGLEYDFFESSPADEIYQETEFEIAMDMKNYGAYPLAGWITLSLEEDYMCLIDDNNECTEYEVIQHADYVKITNTINEYMEQIDDNYKSVQELTRLLRYAERTPTQNASDIEWMTDEIRRLEENASEIGELIDEEKKKLDPKDIAKTKSYVILGKSLWNPQGGREMIKYQAKTKNIGAQSTRHESLILSTACYEYATAATETICIDTDVTETSSFMEVCEAEEINLQDQGAPVAITKIETYMLPKTSDDYEQYVQPQFLIYVENKGEGRVINKAKTEDACTAAPLQKKDYNAIFLQSLTLSTDMWSYHFNGYDTSTGKEIYLGDADTDTIECTPNPLILSDDKYDYFRCTLKQDIAEISYELRASQPSYTTPLGISLSYGYVETRSKDVTIVREP